MEMRASLTAPRKEITQKDVARHAGVTQATVSNGD